MRMIFKVSYYVRSNYENKQGKSPLMIRIYLNREMLTVGSSGLNVDKKLWCNATSRMKGRTQEALCINAQLDEISTSFQEIFKRYEKDDDLTLEKIKSIYLGKDKIKTTFLEYYDGFLEELQAQVGTVKTKATYYKYLGTKRHFENFLRYKYRRKDLMPKELTHLVISDFEIYLRTVANLKVNSSTKTLKFFKTVVKHAQRTGFIIHDPFMNHHFQTEYVDRGFLTDEEIKCIMEKEFATARLEAVRDIFIFSCFCGLAYIDVANLTQDNIVTLNGKRWIMTTRQKTKVPSNILLLDIPAMIIEKYRGRTKDGKLLPILSNQKMNSYLKEIGDVCGIKKNLTYHVARHIKFYYSLRTSNLQELSV